MDLSYPLSKHGRKHSLSYRLLFYILLCSTTFTFISTAFQLYIEYKKDLKRVEGGLTQIRESYLNFLSLSLWNMNDRQLAIQLQGALLLPDIQYLEVRNVKGDSKEVFAVMGTPKKEGVSYHEFNLYHKAKMEKIPIGMLCVTVNLDGVYQRLWDRAILIVTTQTIKTFVWSFCVLLIFQSIIMRNLNRIIRYLKHFDMTRLEIPLSLDRKVSSSTEPDELEHVVIAINDMRKNLILYITKRKQAEEELGFKNAILLTQQETSLDGILVVDEEGEIIHYNQQFMDLWNIPDDVAASRSGKRSIQSVLDKLEKPDEFLEVVRYLNEHHNEKSHDEIALVGGITFERYSSPMFGADGQYLGRVWYFRDITARKHAETEIRKLNEELEQRVSIRTSQLKAANKELKETNFRLQEADRLKSVFLASMSHELRTPLNSIIGFTGIILQGMAGEINEEQRKQLSMAKNSADHLLSLINDLLDIAKIEAGRVELSLEEFSIDEIVREVSQTFSPIVKEKGLELTTDVPEDITLSSDRRRMKQILINFVSNAVKFTDRGSVKLRAIISENNNLQLSVTDTGIGIEAEDMDKLFKPFQQVDTSLAKLHEGTGLGLHLTRKLADLLGGSVSVKSEFGKGSEFIFRVRA